MSKITHGMRNSPEYVVWAGMKARCGNPNNPKYPRYGGRGIAVCNSWRDSFAQFYADMGPKPTPKHSLDRINNSLGYFPENCRWAVDVEQANNRRTTRQFTYGGVTGPLRDIAKHTGVSQKLLKARLDLGWGITRAVETRLLADEKFVTFAGRTQSLSAWGRETGLGGQCISERLRAGWSVEAALTRPKKQVRLYKQEIDNV